MIHDFQTSYEPQFYGHVHPGDHDFPIMEPLEFLKSFAVHYGTRSF